MFPTLIPFTRRPVITLISTFPGYSSLFNFVLILSIALVLSFVRKGHKGKKKNQKQFQTLKIEKKKNHPGLQQSTTIFAFVETWSLRASWPIAASQADLVVIDWRKVLVTLDIRPASFLGSAHPWVFTCDQKKKIKKRPRSVASVLCDIFSSWLVFSLFHLSFSRHTGSMLKTMSQRALYAV